MNEIDLPNLLPDEAAPFLAAVGVVSLLCFELDDPDATLHWPDPLGPARIRTSRFSDLEELAEGLRSVAVAMKKRDELLPGAGPDFPPRGGSGSDPTKERLPFRVGKEWAKQHQQNQALRPWLAAVFATNDAVHSDKIGELALLRNPIFDAGPGSVWMTRTLEPLRNHAAEPAALAASLTLGARRAGDIGGYLDWRADRDASQAAFGGDGTTSMGDPGLTWLAFMGLRVVTVVARSGSAVSSLTPPSRSRRLRKPLLWPVWSRPLRSAGVEILLGHSAVHELISHADATDTSATGAGRARTRVEAHLRALDLHAVYAAPRILKGNNNGAYSPAVRLWPVE
jgi:hypothetical protein